MSDLLDSLTTATLGPEHRWWMNPNIWCGHCGYIHATCKCGDAR